MRSVRRSRPLSGGLVVATFVLAACGAGSDGAGSGAQPGTSIPPVAETGTPVESSSSDAAATPPVAAAGLVDLVGPDVVAAAEIESNKLPSVVVDELGNGRKVNLRNLVPQEKPILLWMWAPH